jgi:hypothetical protein
MGAEVQVTSLLFVCVAYFRSCVKWVWIISCMAVARGKPKFSEKTSPCADFSVTNLGD